MLTFVEIVRHTRERAEHFWAQACKGGMDDPVVPPDQSERFALALASKKTPYAYLTFQGESHGFRRADTVIACLEAELAFYGQTLGFKPQGVDPIDLIVG